MSKVTIYSKPDCGACDLVKTWMANNSVKYDAIDAFEDKQAMADLAEHGFMSFPVITVGGWSNSWIGYNLNKMEELL